MINSIESDVLMLNQYLTGNPNANKDLGDVN
jgi:hypothetical protein